jgi:transcriptional regulator with XRE-family HTH domain
MCYQEPSAMRAKTLLRTARRQAGLTQRELAVRTGIPQSTVARIERGQVDPRTSTLGALLLGCGQMLTTSGFSASRVVGLSDRAERYLPEITQRLAKRFGPSRIILFGSQAKGRAKTTSDIDLLVVMPLVKSKRDLRVAMRQAVADLPIDKDILVMTDEEATTARGGSIGATALREGLLLYDA